MSGHDLTKPFGALALSPWRSNLREAAGRWRSKSSVASSLLRKLSLAGLSEPVDVEPWKGFRTRLYPSQNHTDKCCYLGIDFSGEAESRFMEPAANATPDNNFYFVDIGANSGCYSISAHLVAEKLGKKACILAIEANPEMLERLKFNLEASTITNCQVVGTAVSDHVGSANLDINVRNLGQVSVVADDNASGETLKVATDTLVNILARSGMPRIDFLKIDIEGHEIMALEPYMRDASVDLYPAIILAETIHDASGSIRSLLSEAGYSVLSDGPVDTVFAYDRHKANG